MYKRKQRGFTLLELIITVAISIILLGVGIPGFMGVMDNNRISSTTNNFIQALHLARSEAIRGGSATVCSSADQKNCGGTWEDGWILLDNANNVLRVYESLPSSITMIKGPASTTYTNNGFLTPVGTQIYQLCHSSGSGRQITITTSGRPATATMTC